MEILGWKYYGYAAIPVCAPHEMPDMTPLEDGRIWNLTDACGRKTPLLVRWTTDFDCEEETQFWACVKDAPLDLSQLGAKRRYEITKGNRHYETRLIQTHEIAEMYDVYIESLLGYSNNPQPQDRQSYVDLWLQEARKKQVVLIGAYEKKSGRMCGYAQLVRQGKCISLPVFKTRVSCEKTNVNFALMYGVCKYFEEELSQGSYLFDGWRNIQHKTQFQSYLEKYFMFRKAYCRLHVRYRQGVGLAVKVLFPVRTFLKAFDHIGIIHKINGLLLMEEVVRSERPSKRTE